MSEISSISIPLAPAFSRLRMLQLGLREGRKSFAKAEFFLGLALRDNEVRDQGQEGGSWGPYVLQSRWAWSNGHCDFATFSLDKDFFPIRPEDLLDDSVDPKMKAELLNYIRGIHLAQNSDQSPSPQMVRLYRVVGQSCLGMNPNHNHGELNSDRVEINFSLVPICDFDELGRPIPSTVQGKVSV